MPATVPMYSAPSSPASLASSPPPVNKPCCGRGGDGRGDEAAPAGGLAIARSIQKLEADVSETRHEVPRLRKRCAETEAALASLRAQFQCSTGASRRSPGRRPTGRPRQRGAASGATPRRRGVVVAHAPERAVGRRALRERVPEPRRGGLRRRASARWTTASCRSSATSSFPGGGAPMRRATAASTVRGDLYGVLGRLG
jgi:hypothetical protein